jgi:hypothetical protein
MNPTKAIAELRAHSDNLARQVTAMHPLVAHLANPTAQGEILRALFELTRQVEVVKKQLLRLEKQDNSTML